MSFLGDLLKKENYSLFLPLSDWKLKSFSSFTRTSLKSVKPQVRNAQALVVLHNKEMATLQAEIEANM